ncbi:MAG: hypothetical protein IKK93_11835 [Campylobacter sp.]|nr:hypothetical protein [Campylobacter sp.]
MWQKRLLLVFVLFCSSLGLAFAQEDSPDLDELNQIVTELNKELTIPEMQSLQQELALKMELTLSTADQLSQILPSEVSTELQFLISNSNPSSMSLPELLRLIKKIYNWQTQLSMTYSTTVSENLSLMKNLSDQLSNCLEIANKALLSNKIDTENAIELFGEAQDQLRIAIEENAKLKQKWKAHLELDAEINKRFKNSFAVGTVTSALPGITLITIGMIKLSNVEDQDELKQGWQYVTYGTIALVGVELVYQGGHWIFRIW